MATAALIDSFLLPMTAIQEAQLEMMSSDLRLILSECEVPAVLQAVIADRGYKTINLFAVLADDRAGIRTRDRVRFFESTSVIVVDDVLAFVTATAAA